MSDATVVVGDKPIGRISPRLYGAFAEHLGRCCYDGLWVGPESDIPNVDGFRRDVVDALREMPTPFIRWPGGCYAEHYHWRNGIGPSRPGSLGMSCGLSTEDTNALGTHEFLQFCELIGAEPYLNGNVATGTLQEMCDWIEYVNSAVDSVLTRERAGNGRLGPWGVKVWGVGNESWDCGGMFDPVTYAHEYRKWARMIRDVDKSVELVAVGQADDPLPESNLDPEWNVKFMRALAPHTSLMDHLSVHCYWLRGGPELEFGETDYYALLDEADATEAGVIRARAVVDAVAPASRHIGIALDEWGVWHPEAREWGPGDVARRIGAQLEQANTLRDALAAAIAFEGFHRQCNSLSMANLAQVVNVLQTVIMTDGAKFARTPTYYAIQLHTPHVGARALPVEVYSKLRQPSNRSAVSATASIAGDDPAAIAVTVVNRHLRQPGAIEIRLPEGLGVGVKRVRLLAGDEANAVNVPGEAETVAPVEIAADAIGDGVFRISMPAHSMATVEFSGIRG